MTSGASAASDGGGLRAVNERSKECRWCKRRFNDSGGIAKRRRKPRGAECTICDLLFDEEPMRFGNKVLKAKTEKEMNESKEIQEDWDKRVAKKESMPKWSKKRSSDEMEGLRLD